MPPAAVAVAAICFATFVTVVSWKLPRAKPPQSPSVMKEDMAYGASTALRRRFTRFTRKSVLGLSDF